MLLPDYLLFLFLRKIRGIREEYYRSYDKWKIKVIEVIEVITLNLADISAAFLTPSRRTDTDTP